MSLRSIDLFAGAGGLALGLREAGFETICAVEHDADAARTFATHSPKADVRVAAVEATDLSAFRGQVDLLSGGPPCQPFSSGGLRRGTDDARDGLPAFLDAARAVAPRAVLVENVPGLATGHRRRALGNFLDGLAALGYTTAWTVLNAADYGVPQLRRRLFIVGLKDDAFAFPEASHGPGSARPHIPSGDVVGLEADGKPNAARVTYARNPQLRPNPYHGLLFNGGGRALDPARPAPTILASAGGNKTPFVDTLGLVPDYHAHLSAGGAPRSGDLEGGRRLTVREVARIQTFSDNLAFAGPQSSQYRQIGNAVPVRLAAALGHALARTLSGVTYPCAMGHQVTLFEHE